MEDNQGIIQSFFVGAIVIILVITGVLSLEVYLNTKTSKNIPYQSYDPDPICKKKDNNFKCTTMRSSLRTGYEMYYLKSWYMLSQGENFFLAVESATPENPIPKSIVNWQAADLSKYNFSRILMLRNDRQTKNDNLSAKEFLMSRLLNRTFKEDVTVDGFPAVVFTDVPSSTIKNGIIVGCLILRNKDLVTITVEDRTTNDYEKVNPLFKDMVISRFKFYAPLDPKVKD